MNAFLDTNILLEESNLNQFDKIYISMTSIEELDKLKSNTRDLELAYKAREALRNIKENAYKINIVGKLEEATNDNFIIKDYASVRENNLSVELLTNDLNMWIKANFNSLPCKFYQKDVREDIKNAYKGYKEIILNDEKMAEFYQNDFHKNVNTFDLLENQYLALMNESTKHVEIYKWVQSKYKKVTNTKIANKLEQIKSRDCFQTMLIDSLNSDPITTIFGKAGTGKTYFALNWILSQLESTKLDRVYIAFNSVPLKGNAEIGFLPGTLNEKLLSTNLGTILINKLGADNLNQLMRDGRIILIPTSQIRGIETKDGECIFMTESQNTDIYTMKTLLQRAKEGCKIIIEGDPYEQKDIFQIKNGMLRMIEVFQGTDVFSCVKLQIVYRNKIAEIADAM